jgi:phospho-N-acetylmuramoyl-pentapeptide-transferase
VHNETVRFALTFLTALSVSLVLGAWLIRFFHRKNVIEDTTQPDHAGINAIQSLKKNVPTMGGLMILAAIFICTVIWNNVLSPYVVIGFLVLAVLGSAGFADDYIKLKRKPSRGLTKTQKLVVQFLLGGIVGCLLIRRCANFGETGHFSPLYGVGRFHQSWLYVAWCAFFVAATSNAVNLTDGLDGLAGSLTLLASVAMGLLIYEIGFRPDAFTFRVPMPDDDARCLSCILSGTAGAVVGFLWFNRHPARIFMGDTGSLALGGILAYVALALKLELFLLVAGAVFFIEELTVAVQIASFKLTGKRIFPVTPIHHYFQVNLKWPEQKIVLIASLLGAVFVVLASLLFSANWI